MPYSNIAGKVIVIAGASSGIGRATLFQAAEAGAHVIALARREDRLASACEELEKRGIESWYRAVDLTDAGAVTAAIDSILEDFRAVDVAIYAAGTNSPDRAMAHVAPPVWSEIVDTNLNGAFYLSHALLPAMRSRGSGYLLFVSSTAGVLADMSGAAYQASKRGLLGLSHAIRLEEKGNGIRTACLMPGLTNTELVEKRRQKVAAETLQNALQPDDVAAALLYLMDLPPHVSVPEMLMIPTLS